MSPSQLPHLQSQKNVLEPVLQMPKVKQLKNTWQQSKMTYEVKGRDFCPSAQEKGS